ncbi:MAG: carbohydrate kinase family protein [Ginsengibacter sp.]
MKKYDAVIAGYICVDLIPEFKKNRLFTSISDVLQPGKLIEIGNLNFILGGIVANTGMAMKKFSKKIYLNGVIGDDFIGKIVRERLDEVELSEGIKTIKNCGTAFSFVIAPPGIDRIFLESLGCSNIFDRSYINYDVIAQSRLFHFGYPPLFEHFYRNKGDQLIKMFSKIQGMDVVTSLDFSLPDAESESAKVNWPEILQEVLPFIDIFVPSLEEALLIMMPYEYAQIHSFSQDTDMIDKISLDTIRKLGRKIIDFGAKVVLLKSGHQGAYLFTSDISSINEKHVLNLKETWNHRELWCNAYPVNNNKIKNSSGAGDTSVAAFLSAILDGEGPDASLKYAAIAGRNNLYCYDIYNELNNWSDMTKEMRSETNEIINISLLKESEFSAINKITTKEEVIDAK